MKSALRQAQAEKGSPALGRYNWREAPIPEAEEYLAALRTEAERGAMALQTRLRPEKVKCHVCSRGISPGKEMSRHVVRDEATGLLKNIYFDTAICVARFQRKQTNPAENGQ